MVLTFLFLKNIYNLLSIESNDETVLFAGILERDVDCSDVTTEDNIVSYTSEKAITAPWEDRRQHPLSSVVPYEASTVSSSVMSPSDTLIEHNHHLQRDIRSKSERKGGSFKYSEFLDANDNDNDENARDGGDEEQEDDDTDLEEDDNGYQVNNSYEHDDTYPRKLSDKMMSDYRDTSKNSGRRKTPRKSKKKNNEGSGGCTHLEDYSNEYRLKERLLFTNYYDKTTRPVRSDDTPTTLYVGMSLYHILDTVRA